MVLQYGILLWAVKNHAQKQSRSVSRILSAPRLNAEEATISLGLGLLLGSCGLPESDFPQKRERGEQPLLSYLVLLRVGFVVPPAITPGAVSSYLAFSPFPFDPASSESLRDSGWFVFCDTFRSLPLARQGPLLFTGHRALWSSDFPHPAKGGTRLPDLLRYWYT